MSIRHLVAKALALSLALTTAYATTAEDAITVNTEVRSQTLVALNATVTAINHASREVTLTTEDGTEQDITVSDEVQNLEQVAVGDGVDISYYESVSFEVLQPSEASADAAAVAVMDTASPGDKPAAATTTELAFVATVEAINKDSGTVDLQGPTGEVKTVVVNDPDNLDKVVVGDELLITLTRSIAISVNEISSED